jgi:hypothetical protein
MNPEYVGTKAAKEIAEVYYSRNGFHLTKDEYVPDLIKADPFNVGVNPDKHLQRVTVLTELRWYTPSNDMEKDAASPADKPPSSYADWPQRLSYARNTNQYQIRGRHDDWCAHAQLVGDSQNVRLLSAASRNQGQYYPIQRRPAPQQ